VSETENTFSLRIVQAYHSEITLEGFPIAFEINKINMCVCSIFEAFGQFRIGLGVAVLLVSLQQLAIFSDNF